MKLKLIAKPELAWEGNPLGFQVIDAATGEAVDHLLSLTLHARVDECPRLTIEVVDPDYCSAFDIEVEGRIKGR